MISFTTVANITGKAIGNTTLTMAKTAFMKTEMGVRLLRRLHVEPTHPTSDFDTVYATTLVEFDRGQPRVILDFWRDSVTKQIFKRSFERKDPTLFHRETQELMANKIEAVWRKFDYDPTKDYSFFMAAFQEVVDRTQFPKEIRMDQRITDMESTINYLTHQVSLLPKTNMVEQLHTAMKSLDLSTAESLIDSIKRMTQSVNDFYNIEFDVNNPGHFKFVPKPSMRTNDVPILIRLEIVIPDAFKHCRNADEMLLYSHFKQLPIKADLVRMEVSIGPEMIEQYHSPVQNDVPKVTLAFVSHDSIEVRGKASGDAVGREIVIPPLPFPSSFPASLEFTDTGQTFNFLLGLQEIDETPDSYRLIASNANEQQTLIGIKVTATVSKELMSSKDERTNIATGVTISVFARNGAKTYHRWRIAQLLVALTKDHLFVIRNELNSTKFLRGQGANVSEEEAATYENTLDFLNKAMAVQERFGVELELSQNPPDPVDVHWLNVVSYILAHGKARRTINEAITISVSSPNELAQLIEASDSGDLKFVILEDEFHVELFGTNIVLGRRIQYYPNLQIVDAERIKRLLPDLNEGDSLQLRVLTVDETSILDIFPDFYGTDDYGEIMEREFGGR